MLIFLLTAMLGLSLYAVYHHFFYIKILSLFTVNIIFLNTLLLLFIIILPIITANIIAPYLLSSDFYILY